MANKFNIPSTIVDNKTFHEDLPLAFDLAWNYLNKSSIKPLWGDEIIFDCEQYRCLGLFYTDGTKIIEPYYEDDQDDYGYVPKEFTVLDGNPERSLNYWTPRTSGSVVWINPDLIELNGNKISMIKNNKHYEIEIRKYDEDTDKIKLIINQSPLMITTYCYETNTEIFAIYI